MKPNPIGSEKCGKADCVPCMTGGKGCHVSNACYDGTCEVCALQKINAKYYGETARNLYTRAGEHDKKSSKGDPNSFIQKHQAEAHNSAPPKFKFSTIKSFKDPLSRQVTEAMLIKNHTGGPLLNSKAEFFQPPLVRIQQEVLTGLE